MKPCEIAVIVPVHNAAAFLTACTDAIAAQKFDGFRCILVEDGSTDDSPALCDAIAAGDQRFVALHQTNSGVCAARTAGVREGRALGAKWFAFCDADDLYHPEFLDTLYAAVTNSGLPLACCRYDTFTDTVPADAPAPCNSKILRSPAHLDALLHDHAVDYGLWNKLFSADLLTEEMLDNGLAYNEDLLANWRAFLAAPGCAFCDFAGYHYRQHADSASHRALPPQSIDDQRRAAAEIRATAPAEMQQSVNAFYYEKLVYLASMILRRANAADYRVQLNELKIGIAAGARRPAAGAQSAAAPEHPAFGLADAAHAAALAVGVPKFLEGPTIMRILLVLDRVENPASANALMGFRLAEQLLRRDHTVHILTLWDGLHTPPAPPEGAMQHLLAFARRAPR